MFHIIQGVESVRIRTQTYLKIVCLSFTSPSNIRCEKSTMRSKGKLPKFAIESQNSNLSLQFLSRSHDLISLNLNHCS